MNNRINFVDRLVFTISKMNLFLKASSLLAVFSIILLLLVEYVKKVSDIWQVLLVIVGMTVMASVTYFQNYLWDVKKTRLKNTSENNQEDIIEPYLNEKFLEESIKVAFEKKVNIEKILEDKKYRSKENLNEWVITSEALVGKDNALALAKLRIDLETNLRRLAIDRNIDLSEQGRSIQQLTQFLAKEKILPNESLVPIKEIAEICNKGIHGINVSNEETQKAINIGYKLIDYMNHIFD